MSATDQRDGPSRVEREIREILERADTPPSAAQALQSAVRRQSSAARAQLSRRWRPSFSSDLAKLGGALLLALAAALLSGASHVLAILLAIASGIAFLSLWFPSRSGGPGGSPRWRGRDLNDPGPLRGPSEWPVWPRRGPGRPRE
jgi:hypothetical protein